MGVQAPLGDQSHAGPRAGALAGPGSGSGAESLPGSLRVGSTVCTGSVRSISTCGGTDTPWAMGSESSLRPSADKVDAYLRAHGLVGRVREIPQSTRTARDAAQAMGCHISQIAKSVVFRGETSGRPILVIVSGANRVDEASMGTLIGEGIQRADPEWVREITGFPIGGVPPVAHRSPVARYIDRDLLTHPEVYAAAGHPNALFRITPGELLDLVEAPVIQVDGPSPELTRDPGDPLPVSWITFDCYGTLVDWETGMERAFRSVLGPEEARETLRRYGETERAVESRAYRPYRQILREVTRSIVKVGKDGVSQFRQGLLEETLPEWPLFPETTEILQSLRKLGFKLAILSNIDRDLLAATIRRIGVPFHRTVTSEDTGTYKPHPAHWIRFWKDSGAPPATVVHVAGSLSYDVGTARRLGFRTVWVNRRRESAPPHASTWEIADLRGLPDLLAPFRPPEGA